MSDKLFRLGIRADADASIGTGHIMRCLALAQVWRKRGGDVLIFTHATSPMLLEQLMRERLKVVRPLQAAGTLLEAAEVSETAIHEGLHWMVIDGYHFSSNYLSALKGAGMKLLVIDDLATQNLAAADVILNPNAFATPSMYPTVKRHLTGSRFALIRAEFSECRERQGLATEDSAKIVVTLGGSDFHNVTQRVVQLLAGIKNRKLKINVVVGSTNPHLESLSKLQIDSHELEIMVNPPNLPFVFNSADIAISASGSSCWEFAYLGVPMQLIIAADNQLNVAACLQELGIAEVLGWHEYFPTHDSLKRVGSLLNDANRRSSMSKLGKSLVDGYGTARVAEVMLHHPLRARLATKADAQLLWEWVNDAEVRASAFKTAHISWEDHLAWFTCRLCDSMCVMAVVLDDSDTPIGQVRFEGDEGEAVVDISVAPVMRGRGYAVAVLRLGLGLLFEDSRWLQVKASVKVDNAASQRTFARAGFRRVGEKEMHGGKVIAYSLSRHEFF